MNTFQKIEALLNSLGALNAIAFPGFISSEWASKALADLAAVNMQRAGCAGCKVSNVGGTWFCNWDQA